MLPAIEAVESIDTDLVYLDPPYNQHSYLGNYHIWETIVRGDEPNHYGIACKRVDCRERKSAFNRKTLAHDALRDVLLRIDAPHVLVSFNDEGFVEDADLRTMLASIGEVTVITKDFKRYVGAQIGIHNPKGEKVGRVRHLQNRERLYHVRRAGRISQAP